MTKTFLPILTAALLAGISSTHAQSLLITEVYPSGSGNLTYGVDWFELTNFGSSAVDITGWKMDDGSAAFLSSVPFGTEITTIGAGKSVIFLETSSANFAARVSSFNTVWFGTTTSSLLFGSYNGSQVGLGTGGDAVNIFDSSGNVLANVTFGATTAGATLDNYTGANGALSTYSAVGTNGAFTSANGLEIGSPGVVPEPSSAALLGFGTLALLALRRISRKS